MWDSGSYLWSFTPGIIEIPVTEITELSIILQAVVTHTHTLKYKVYHHQWKSSPPVFCGPWGFVSARQPTVSTVTVVQMSPAATEMTGRTGGEEEWRDGERGVSHPYKHRTGTSMSNQSQSTENEPCWQAPLQRLFCTRYFREFRKFEREWPPPLKQNSGSSHMQVISWWSSLCICCCWPRVEMKAGKQLDVSRNNDASYCAVFVLRERLELISNQTSFRFRFVWIQQGS